MAPAPRPPTSTNASAPAQMTVFLVLLKIRCFQRLYVDMSMAYPSCVEPT
jgi:hypothetical protein